MLIDGDDELTIRTELVGGMGKYGRLLGWLYIGDAELSLNEQMITEGYAWAYDGGTKKKDFEELREIRRAHAHPGRMTALFVFTFVMLLVAGMEAT